MAKARSKKKLINNTRAAAEATVIVLSDDVDATKVDEVAHTAGWRRSGDTTRAHFILASLQWVAKEGTGIAYLEDHVGNVRYLRVEGPHTERVADLLREQLPHQTEAELLEEAITTEDPLACIRLTSKLAVCRPARMDPEHLLALKRLLGYPEVAVRRAAIRTAYTCAWPELSEVIELCLKDEQRLKPQLLRLQEHLRGATKEA